MLDNQNWMGGFKIFAESTKLNWIKRAGTDCQFMLGIFSGDAPYIFMFSPQHMKEFMQMLQYNIEEFEKQNGKVNVKWTPLIPSPFNKEPGAAGPDPD